LNRHSRKLLWDVRVAIDRIVAFTAGRERDDYSRDLMLRSAVERQLEIVGEALSQLRKADPDTAARIPDLPKVVGLRNILIHAYADVDDDMVWAAVRKNLPALRDQLDALGGDPGQAP
jgi:uncharacterized protein with HEPN domain